MKKQFFHRAGCLTKSICMGKYSLVAWYIIILFPLVSKSQEVQFMPVHFSEKYQYSTIGAMTQDWNGYVWLADRSFGLFKYDGAGFSHYSHNPYNYNSVCSDLLECVAADKRGNIWIGTNQNGLDRLEPETAVFTHFTHNDRNRASICCDSVKALLVDRDGTLWIGTSKGLDTLDSKAGEFTHVTCKTTAGATLKQEYVNTLYQDREGVIWIGCGSAYWGEGPVKGLGGLYRYDKKTRSITHYLHNNTDAASLTDDRVGAIFEDSRGVFWVGTAGDGLHIMNRKNGTFIRCLYDPHNPRKLSRSAVKNTPVRWVDHITFINEDVQGCIWIGTLENGLNRYDPVTGICEHFSKEENGPYKTNTDNYWTCIKTREHLLWMSSFEAGNPQRLLYRVTPSYPKIAYEYLGKQPYSFANGTVGSIWMGASRSRLLQLKSNQGCDTFYVDKNKTLGGKDIISLENDGTNGLWVSTFRNGLYRYNIGTGSSTIYEHDDKNLNSLVSNNVYATQLDGNRKIWIGTGAGLDLLDVTSGRFTHYRCDPKDSTTLSNDFVTAIKKDGTSNIWVGTTDGINRFVSRTQKCTQYLRGNNIFGITIDSRNRVWVSTQNSGLYLFNAQTDKFTHYEDTGGLIKDDMPVFAIVEDRQHYLWLSTQSGFIKLNPDAKTAWWYGKSWGITSLTSATFISKQGEIYNGERAGYYHFLPGALNSALSADQPPFLNKFYLGNAPVKPGAAASFLPLPLSQTKQIELKYNQNNFALEYNYVDFLTDPEDIIIEYKLENYDDAWRKSGEEKKANYYNVPPGKYIFRVKALNMFGNWYQKSITIIITPPWWQTWWAYVLYVVFAAGCVWGFIYVRSKRLIKENKLLEQKIKMRTAEVQEQKAELTIQRDSLEKTLGELKSTQAQLIQSEKMASLGELTSGIAHEIQNPLNFVNNFSEVSIEMLDELATELTKGDKDEAVAIAEDLKQTLTKINQHGKRAENIVKGMLQHSRQSTGVKEITDINKLVDEFFKLAYHGLRAKDKDFTAELVTHFDEKLPKANVVPQDMGRVMLNLFNNAFYAVNQKKKKTAGADYKPEVSVTTSTENGMLIIKVKDNGSGIPNAIKEKIMQPFFTTKPTGEGTGLGLSLTYDMVVKGHGGSIRAESVEGEGSEFIVSLPLN